MILFFFFSKIRFIDEIKRLGFTNLSIIFTRIVNNMVTYSKLVTLPHLSKN